MQHGLSALPKDQWGNVVKNYTQLYGNVQDYTDQLKNLEKARDAKPDSPALRFLLGYQFGFLNYPKQAVRELDKAVQVEPKDKLAKELRDVFAAKLNGADQAPETKTDRPQGPPPQPEAADPEEAPVAAQSDAQRSRNLSRALSSDS